MRSVKLLTRIILALIVGSVILSLIYFALPQELKLPFLRLLAFAAVILCPVIILIDLIFLLPTIHGAVYYTSSDEEVATIVKLAKLRKNQKAVDIGSGDGRIVRALAETGAHSYGYEVNPILVLLSLWRTRNFTFAKNTHFRWVNLWWSDLSQFDVIVIFGMTYIMSGLEKKMLQEIKPGTKVICNSFPFPHWKYDKKVGNIYLYTKE